MVDDSDGELVFDHDFETVYHIVSDVLKQAGNRMRLCLGYCHKNG